MAKREAQGMSIAFLDLLSGALGAVIILFVAVPKSTAPTPENAPIKPKEETVRVEENKIDKYKAFETKLDGYIETMEDQTNLIADLENENKLLNHNFYIGTAIILLVVITNSLLKFRATNKEKHNL